MISGLIDHKVEDVYSKYLITSPPISSGPHPAYENRAQVGEMLSTPSNNISPRLSTNGYDRATISQFSDNQIQTKESPGRENSEKAVEEIPQSNVHLRTYRQASARRSGQSARYIQSADETQPSFVHKAVTLYNQAITAYIRQDLFFDSISKIGLYVKV